MQFLREHNGLRPGEFSVVVGKSGHGKSGLLKTLAVDAIISGIDVYMPLSEETQTNYKAAIYHYINHVTDEFEHDRDAIRDRLHIDEMLDEENWGKQNLNYDFFFTRVEKYIDRYDAELVIFDNFTTSFFDQLSISKQGEAISDFRSLARRKDVAVVAAFHTIKGTDTYNNLLTGDDVRGNSSSTNSGSYNYILTTYFLEKTIALMFVDKARYHGHVNKTYWILNYLSDFGIYNGAKKISLPDLQELLKTEREKMVKKNTTAQWRK